jgi:hypothetical protein
MALNPKIALLKIKRNDPDGIVFTSKNVVAKILKISPVKWVMTFHLSSSTE